MPRFDAVEYQERLVAAFANAAAVDLRRDYITVTARDAHFRIPARQVSSVDPLPAATPIPRALPWVLGVSNVRGRILTLAHFEHLVTGVRTSEPAYCLSLHDSPYALAVIIDLSDEGAPIVELSALLPPCAINPGNPSRTTASASS